MANKEERSAYIKRTRESMEKKGQVNLVFDFGLTIKFGIKDGKLCWKMDKQYASLNKMQIIPGFNFAEIKMKETYIATDKTESLEDTDEKTEGAYILKSVDNALSRIPIARKPGIFLAAGYNKAPNLSKSEQMRMGYHPDADTDDYGYYSSNRHYSGNPINSNVGVQESRIYEAVAAENEAQSGTVSSGAASSSIDASDLVGKIILYKNTYCVVSSYNDMNEVYDMVQVCKHEGEDKYLFFIKKLLNVSKDEVDDAEDVTDKFISIIVNSENKPNIYGNIVIDRHVENDPHMVRKICKNVVTSFVLKCVDDFDSVRNISPDAARRSSDEFNSNDSNLDLWDTDDIYNGEQPENYKYIFKYKEPSFVEIRIDSVNVEKIVDQKEFIDIESKGERILRIKGEEIAKYARTARESNAIRIFINSMEIRPNECYAFLERIFPDILISTKHAATGFKNDAKAFWDRTKNSVLNPMSKENNAEAAKRPNNEFYRHIKGK